MSEPISTSTATAALAGVTVASLMPFADPAVVIGAFTGATLFVMTDEMPSHWRRIILFIASFLGGCLCAQLISDVVSNVLPEQISVHTSVGAIIGSALLVRLMQLLQRLMQNPESFISMFRGKS